MTVRVTPTTAIKLNKTRNHNSAITLNGRHRNGIYSWGLVSSSRCLDQNPSPLPSKDEVLLRAYRGSCFIRQRVVEASRLATACFLEYFQLGFGYLNVVVERCFIGLGLDLDLELGHFSSSSSSSRSQRDHHQQLQF